MTVWGASGLSRRRYLLPACDLAVDLGDGCDRCEFGQVRAPRCRLRAHIALGIQGTFLIAVGAQVTLCRAVREERVSASKARRCFRQTVTAMVLFTAARAAGLPGPVRYVWVSVGLLTAVLVLVAWTAGAARADLGLDRTDVGAAFVTGPAPSQSCCWS